MVYMMEHINPDFLVAHVERNIDHNTLDNHEELMPGHRVDYFQLANGDEFVRQGADFWELGDFWCLIDRSFRDERVISILEFELALLDRTMDNLNRETWSF